MAAFLGLLGAFVYGAGDFVGGLTSRRAEHLAVERGSPTGAAGVVVWSQIVGLAILLVLLVFERRPPTASALVWGAVAGVGGGLGVLFLYRGLARGRMSVVAPVSAAIAAVIPLVYGVATGERPAVVAWAGVALALAAVVLVSRGEVSGDAPARAGIPEAIGSGLGFGVWFVALGMAGEGGTWALIAARTSIPVVALLALATRQPLTVARVTWPGVALTGLCDQAANVIYLLASRRGMLSLVAVLTSLYPASTVLLARIVLKERFTGTQLVGLSAAVGGVVLIALG